MVSRMKPAIRSPRRLRLLLFAILMPLVLSVSREARAETSEDVGLWLMLMMEGPIGGQQHKPSKFRWWLDIQPRFLDDVSGVQQSLFRPGVGYALGERTTVWLGYARVRTKSSSGASSDEDRIWQQFLWKPSFKKVAFQSRTRLEQRFLDTGSQTGWRFRQFLKASWGLPNASRFSLVGYEEIFLNLNETDWGQRSGFAQNRLFAGLGMKLSEQGRTKIEAGYLNQFIDRAAADQMNHILSINLFLNF